MKAIELLAYNLTKLQEHAGFSSAELATRANVSADYVQRLLQGQEDCTVELLQRFADILECSVRNFFCISKNVALNRLIQPSLRRRYFPQWLRCGFP